MHKNARPGPYGGHEDLVDNVRIVIGDQYAGGRRHIQPAAC